MATFNNMIFRLVNILINKIDFNKKKIFGIIKKITKCNRYNNMISKLIQKQK